MMKIELLKQGKFTTSGKSVLVMMQNNNTPTLDLVVREAIQNSLDAARPDAKNVLMSFKYGSFNASSLSNEFEVIGDRLKEKYGSIEANFISITDAKTVGLTGNLDGNFKFDEQNQNLGKLVFHIMKAQDHEGAGGSWGIGKTVYYRMGIGLVIYYSRIKLDDGRYQQRLVSALVEDETNPLGMLSGISNSLGVAFFGDVVDGSSRAITDDDYINRFLKIFNIPPLSNDETGTTIIIPFVDEKELLRNNIDEGKSDTWWNDNIVDYLKLSILRWYFPRLSSNYTYGPKLLAFVNNDPVQPDINSPLYKKYMELYNATYEKNYPEWIHKEPIIRKTNLNEETLGYFMYGVVNKADLLMIKHNLPNPYEYALIDGTTDSETNDPLIAFCRKPGMIVNYDCKTCTGNIKTDKNEYIIGLFVLNSNNFIISPARINLDEYIRQSEKADHTSWTDHQIEKNSGKILIVQMIFKQIAKYLNATYGEKEPVSGDSSIAMNFANKFGKLLLPDSGFGSSGSEKNNRKSYNKRTRKINKKVRASKKNIVEIINAEYKKNLLLLTYNVQLYSKNRSLAFTNYIVGTEGGIMPYEFENNGEEYPCNINSIGIKCLQFAEKPSNENPIVIDDFSAIQNFHNYNLIFKKTSSGKVYGVEFDNNGVSRQITFTLRISLETTDSFVNTNFDVEMKEEK